MKHEIFAYLKPEDLHAVQMVNKEILDDVNKIKKLNKKREPIEKQNFIEALSGYLANKNDIMYVFDITKINEHFAKASFNELTTGNDNVKQFLVDNASKMIQTTTDESEHRKSLIETVILFLPHKAYALVIQWVDHAANNALNTGDDLRMYNHENRSLTIQGTAKLAHNDILLVNTNVVSSNNNVFFINSRIVIFGPDVESIAGYNEDIEEGAFINFDDSTTETIIISNSVKSIPKGAFADLPGLLTVIIPDSVTSIGEIAFKDCWITSITIPDSVTTIGESAFSECFELMSLHIGNAVASIGDNAFFGCVSLKSVIIPDSVETICDGAFSWCEGMKDLTIGNSVTSIGDNAFFECFSLKSVIIPDSLKGDNKMKLIQKQILTQASEYDEINFIK